MTDYTTTTNVITPADDVLNYDFKFNNDFKLKPYQKATVLKMLKHEEQFFVQTTIPKKLGDILENELCMKQDNNYNYHTNDDNTLTVVKKNLINKDKDNYKFNFHTNVGALSNEVGSGKTSIVLGLIKYKKLIKERKNLKN